MQTLGRLRPGTVVRLFMLPNPGRGEKICKFAIWRSGLGASAETVRRYGCGTADGTGETSKIPRVYAAWYGGTAKTLLCVPLRRIVEIAGLKFGF